MARIFNQKSENESTSLLERYCGQGFKLVDGWGIDDELIRIIRSLDRFQQSIGLTGNLLEIGVHHGRTLILFALLAKEDEKVFGVDLFEQGQHANLDDSGSGAMGLVMDNLQAHCPNISVELIMENSFLLARHQKFDQFANARLVHIDGGHFHEVVLNDMNIAQSVIGDGGIIIVDDYLHSGFPEVQEAVHHYFNVSTRKPAIPFAIGKNKLFLCELSRQKAAIEWLADQMPPERRKPVKVMGYRAICLDPH